MTPQEIEAAADAAVARYRDRIATGWVPVAPDLPPMPPRRRVALTVPAADYSHVAGSKDWARKTGRPVERPRPGGRRRG